MRLHLPKAEFYITNVCNFNCSGCNRFNNYFFSGNQLWRDYQAIYAAWADRIDLDQWSVLGGEPMTNPDYLDWLWGIQALWPQAQGIMTTNGYYLQPGNTPLYDFARQMPGRFLLQIGLHNADRRNAMLETAQSWLTPPIEVKRVPDNLTDLPGFQDNWRRSYAAIKDPGWPDCDQVQQWPELPASVRRECQELHGFSPELLAEQRKELLLTDRHGVQVLIANENFFYESALIPDHEQGVFRLHQSRPEQAHQVCAFAQNRCYHFIKGSLYKCGPVALLPEFAKQYPVVVDADDHALLHSYRSADLGMDQTQLADFIATLDLPIAQCKFCPENPHATEIAAASNQKSRIIPKLNRKGPPHERP